LHPRLSTAGTAGWAISPCSKRRERLLAPSVSSLRNFEFDTPLAPDDLSRLVRFYVDILGLSDRAIARFNGEVGRTRTPRIDRTFAQSVTYVSVVNPACERS
jgi:hypothetical protein